MGRPHSLVEGRGTAVIRAGRSVIAMQAVGDGSTTSTPDVVKAHRR
jgi:hypothetical protein